MRGEERVSRLRNIKAAASYLGVSARTVYQLTRDGELPVVRVSKRRVMYDLDDLDQWIDSRKTLAEQVRG